MINIEIDGLYLIIFTLTISAISIALQEYIKSIANWIPKTLWKYSYSRWGGTGIFHRTSVKKYKNYIKQKYSEIYVPFRPGRPLILQNIYVPLRLYQSQISEKVDSKDVIRKFSRLVVVGEPGSGKSTMLRHLLLSFTNNPSNKFLNSKFPILLELNRLADPRIKLYDELLSTLNSSDSDNKFPNGGEFLTRRLKEGNLIIFMDGLDEITPHERSRVIQNIKDFATKYSKISFVITCRSAVYNNELHDIVDQTLEIVEFDDNQISQFLTSWEKELPPYKSVNQLLKTLHDRPRIMELARNPLMLTIIAYLYCDTEHELPHSRAEFYKKSCDVLLDLWHNTHNEYSAASKTEILKHLALFNQVSSKDQNRKTIDYIVIMEEIRKIMPLINKDVKESEKILKEIVERSGLLISIDGGYTYQFAHLTLQEYFAAEALSDKKEDLINYYFKSQDTWRETIKLWCGLSHNSTSLINELYDIDPTLAFECLADAVKVDNELADKIISKFESDFTVKASSEKIQKAFGAVASNLKTPRGLKTFNFLVSILENSDLDPSIRQSAAFSLSDTNLPRASEVLVSNLLIFKGCESSLIKMGDLAVAALEKPNGETPIHHVEILLKIGTPVAAKALVPYLWDNTSSVEYMAAWGIGSLIRRYDIEQVLKNNHFQHENEYGTFDWIWSPFEGSSSSSLSKICGRIGYILNTYDPTLEYLKNFKIDNRIIIPLFLINLDDSVLTSVNRIYRESHPPLLPPLLTDEIIPNRSKWSPQQKDLNDKLAELMDPNSRLSIFFNCIDDEIKLKILAMFPLDRRLSKSDWININKTNKYDIHAYSAEILTLLCALINIISYGYIFYSAFYYILPLANLSKSSIIISGVLILIVLSLTIFIKYSEIDKIIDSILECDHLVQFMISPLIFSVLLSAVIEDGLNFRSIWYSIEFALEEQKLALMIAMVSNYFFIRLLNEVFNSYFIAIIIYLAIIIIGSVTLRKPKKSNNLLKEIIIAINQNKVPPNIS